MKKHVFYTQNYSLLLFEAESIIKLFLLIHVTAILTHFCSWFRRENNYYYPRE